MNFNCECRPLTRCQADIICCSQLTIRTTTRHGTAIRSPLSTCWGRHATRRYGRPRSSSRESNCAGKWPVLAPDNLSLTLALAPNWEAVGPLTPEDREFHLLQRPDRMAMPGGIYPQLARLGWADRGYHHSKLIPWSVRTDQRGQWLTYDAGVVPRARLVEISHTGCKLLSITTAGLGLLWTLLAFRQRRIAHPPGVESSLVRYLGWLLAAGISLWVADHTRLDLWILPTWATGGDTASHILYANVFRDWVAHGKLSGWMPEVFMGFPAFSYYFPMPFVLGVYLSTANRATALHSNSSPCCRQCCCRLAPM